MNRRDYLNNPRYIPISKEEGDMLYQEGITVILDLPSGNCGGFFESSREDGKNKHFNIILLITDEGKFIRAREDLIKSNDKVFMGFIEDGKPPEFEDVFRITRI